jgi:hypothetical protein
VIARLWPEPIRAGTDAWFGPQDMLNALMMEGAGVVQPLSFLREALENPALVTLPLWAQGFTPLQTVDLGGPSDAPADGALGALQAAQAMARRDYADAERRYTLLWERYPQRHDVARLRVLAALMGGARERAQAYAVEAIESEGDSEPGAWEWLEDLLNQPVGVRAARSGPGS